MKSTILYSKFKVLAVFCLLIGFQFTVFSSAQASAQGTKTVAVKVSNQTQRLNNKEYYVHIVEQGQTVFSIARAYGLKYYDAVIKTDIHLMKVGDTVWLPKNEYSVAAVTANADAAVSRAEATHYIKIEPGQTLYSLSREYGVSIERIIEANPELRNEQLKAGQMLKIPPQNSETKAEQVEEVKPEPKSEVKQEVKSEVKPEPKQETKTEVKAEPRKEVKPEYKPETKAEPKPEPEVKQETKPEVKPEPKKEAKPEYKSEPKKEVKPEYKPEAKAEPKPEVKQETKSEVKPGPKKEAKPEYKPEPKPEEKAVTSTSVTDPVAESSETMTKVRVVVNPYPYAEVPGDFPKQQAPYYNFTTSSPFSYQVRDRQDKSRIFISVVMPLNLDKINEISTSKFDIEQRGKKEYKVFEFIQFYEGILMALDEIQSQGIDVVLNVVDLTSDKDEDVVNAFNSHDVANSDFIIALLIKKPFHKLAELAKQHQVFVINPFSSREDVVKDNPYVVKYMPSTEGTVKGILDIMASKHKGGHLYILHSNNKSVATDENAFREEFEKQLAARKDIKYTFFDWTANGKLLSTLKTTTDNVIVSVYNQDKNKNTVFATTLLNRLSSVNSNVPTLITVNNYLTEYPNVDFDQLQHLKYTTVTMGYLDYGNARHKAFIDTYKDKFHTEPNTLYAGVAHDIMLYFTTALSQQGAEFWRNPGKFKTPDGMLFPFRIEQSSATGGYENQLPDIYQMINYRLVK